MAKTKEFYLNYWYIALASPMGIEVQSSTAEAESLKGKLYYLRKCAQDKDLDGLSIVFSPFDKSKLWIVKRNPTNAAA